MDASGEPSSSWLRFKFKNCASIWIMALPPVTWRWVDDEYCSDDCDSGLDTDCSNLGCGASIDTRTPTRSDGGELFQILCIIEWLIHGRTVHHKWFSVSHDSLSHQPFLTSVFQSLQVLLSHSRPRGSTKALTSTSSDTSGAIENVEVLKFVTTIVAVIVLFLKYVSDLSNYIACTW
jgi:hypothetical protein